MKKTMSKRALQVVVFATVGLLALSQGIALAGDSPEPPSAPTAEAPEAPAPDDGGSAPSAPTTTSGTQEAPAAPQTAPLVPEAPTEDDDIPPHETEDPSGSPHASGSVAEATLLGEVDVVAGHTNAQIDDTESDDTSSDVTILSINGEDVVPGLHADSDGPTEESQGALIACEQSDGAICVGLLFAQATANEDENTSTATADVTLAFVCVGGANPEPTGPEDCTDAPVSAGVSESHSSIEKDKQTGESEADQETRAANACLGGEDPVTGVCTGIGAEALESESHSEIRDENNNGTTEDDTGTTERSSSVLAVQAGGEEPVLITDPMVIALPNPAECMDPSLLCVFLNQGESFEFVGGAGSRQEAIHIDLPGPPEAGAVLLAHAGVAETLVEGQAGIEPPPPVCPDGVTPIPPGGIKDCPNGPPPPPGCPPVCPRDGDDVLAFTGFGALPLLALSLILGTGGGSVLAWDRRRRDSR